MLAVKLATIDGGVGALYSALEGASKKKRFPNAYWIGKRERGTASVLDFGGMISGYQSVSVFTLKEGRLIEPALLRSGLFRA